MFGGIRKSLIGIKTPGVIIQHYHEIQEMTQEHADFSALPNEDPSSPRDERHEHLVYLFFSPRISLPPFHQIPAVDMEVSVDNGVETT